MFMSALVTCFSLIAVFVMMSGTADVARPPSLRQALVSVKLVSLTTGAGVLLPPVALTQLEELHNVD